MINLVALAGLICMPPTEGGPAEAPSQTGMLKCIFVTMESGNRPFSEFPLTMMDSVIRRNLPAGVVEIHRFKIDEEADTLLDRIEQQVKTNSSDTVLVYYFGAGGLDPDTGQVQLGEGAARLGRQRFKAEVIRRLEPRLLIFLTDCAVVHQPATAAASSISLPPNEIPAGFRRLFFEASGVVDINGCSPDEIGTATVKIGDDFIPEPAFTRAIVANLWKNVSSETAGWKPLVAQLCEDTARLFKTSFPDGLTTRGPRGDQITQGTQSPVARLAGASAALDDH